MSTLRLVESPDDILASLNTFNVEAASYSERSKLIFQHTWYWVYDPSTERFGPGKFVGFRGMTFGTYEDGNQGRTTGAAFQGKLSKVAIEAALHDSFKPDPDMNDALVAWGTELLGINPFAGTDSDKWNFVSLEDPVDDSDTPKKPRNPNWQRDELILVLDLYVRHAGNPPSHSHPDVIELSRVLNELPIHSYKGNDITFRNANSVYLKVMNFRRFDPNYKGGGMQRGNKLEKVVWDDFQDKPELLHRIAERILAGYPTVGDAQSHEPEEETFLEGRVLYRMHRMRERNSAIIEKAKQGEKKKKGKLSCWVCDFSFADFYGPLGEDFIEGHHTKPIAELDGKTETKVSDIALVCANCHRMLHRVSNISINELRSMIRNLVPTALKG